MISKILVFGLIFAVFSSGCILNEEDNDFDDFFSNENGESLETENFIVANPVDLEQINSISKFRSCAGHDYSGTNVNGEFETQRSMKHYLEPKQGLEPTNSVKVFAPFDGIISEIEVDQDPRGKQVWLSPGGGWHFIFFHIDHCCACNFDYYLDRERWDWGTYVGISNRKSSSRHARRRNFSCNHWNALSCAWNHVFCTPGRHLGRGLSLGIRKR